MGKLRGMKLWVEWQGAREKGKYDVSGTRLQYSGITENSFIINN